MADYNKTIVVGRLTRDPETKTTGSGVLIANLGVVTNDRRKDASGQYVDNPQFIDVTVFNKQAEFCQNYIRKGHQVFLELKFDFQQWEDRTTGQKRSKLGFVAMSVQNLTPRDQSAQQPNRQSQQQQAAQTPQAAPPPPFPEAAPPQTDSFDVSDESIDDIPF